MADKIYTGSGKEKFFNDGGSLIGITLDIETLQQNFKEYGFVTQQGKKKIKVNVSSRREIDQYGNSHTVTIDTFKPQMQGQPGQQQGGNNANQNNNPQENNNAQFMQNRTPAGQQNNQNYTPPSSPVGGGEFDSDIPFSCNYC